MNNNILWLSQNGELMIFDGVNPPYPHAVVRQDTMTIEEAREKYPEWFREIEEENNGN